jgi:NhaA family Na+:H+ antiporter
MPIFALANAGVRIDTQAFADPLASRVLLGVALGLLVGKPLGITLLSWLAVRLRVAVLPQGVGWSAILGAGVLAGIGFTMSLFITVLAFEEPQLVAASKLGVLVASALAAFGGLVLLARVLPPAAGRTG